MLEVVSTQTPAPQPNGAERVAWLLDRSPEAALLTDPRGVIEYVNPAFEAITGYARAEALGRRPSILKSGMQSPEFYQRLWHTVRAGREFCDVLVNRRKSGETFHEEKTIRPLFDDRGRISHYLSSGRDVSERLATIERLTRAATHDTLTGLPNRQLFTERLAALMSGARREGDRFTVVLVDVNDFKAVNDSRGHLVGDAVLHAVGQRLLHLVREGDTVARLGGDEFGILLPGTGEPADARQWLRKLVDGFASPLSLGAAGDWPVSVSAGACVRTLADIDERPLLERADTAMYRAKREGGARGQLFGDDDSPGLAPAAHARSPEALIGALDGVVPMRSRRLRAGEVVYRAGQAFDCVYAIRAGAVKLVSATAGGRERIVGMKFRDDWLGLEGIARQRYAWDAVATDVGEVLVVDYAALLQSTSRVPQLLPLLMETVGRQLAQADSTECALGSLPADARVARFLSLWNESLESRGLRGDQITMPLTRAEIGTHLGMTLETVSRSMTRLARKQLIRFADGGHRCITIPSVQALADFARCQDGG